MLSIFRRSVRSKIILGYLMTLSLLIVLSVLATARFAWLSATVDTISPEWTSPASLTEGERTTQTQKETLRSLIVETRNVLLGSTGLALVTALLLGVAISRDITAPLERVMRASQQIAHVDLPALTRQMTALRQGHIQPGASITAQPLQITAEDEVGQMARAFDEIVFRLRETTQAYADMASYLQDMADAANRVAQGNLSEGVAARSPDDVLGSALAHMLDSLRAAQEQSQRQLARLSALRRIDALIATSLDLGTILQIVLEQLAAQIDVETAEVLVLNSSGELDLAAQVGPFQTAAEFLPPLDPEYARRVLAERQPVRLGLNEGQPAAARQRDYYGYPLIAEDQVRGILQVVCPSYPEPTPEALDFLSMLAGQSAIAISHIKLIQTLEQRIFARTAELERRAMQLQTAAEVSRAASGMLELDPLLQQSVDLIRERFGWYYVGLFFLEGQRVCLRAGTGEPGQLMLKNGHGFALDDNAMVAWCVQHAQARIALDAGTEPVRFDNPLLPDTRSEIALPLISRRQVIGALSVQSDQPQAFGAYDLAVLQTMTDHLANAIDNARLYTAAHQRAERMTALNEIGQALASTLSLDNLYTLIHQQAQQVVQVDAYYIALYDEDTQTIFYPVFYDDGQYQAPATEPLGYGPTSLVIRTRTPCVYNRLQDAPASLQTFGNAERPTSSALHVPMLSGDHLIGVLSVQSYAENIYEPEDLQMLQVIASQAAISVENARLYASLEQELAERKRAEAALKQSNLELHTRNEELDAFAHTVAHDLKNPLGNITGFSELLLLDYDLLSDEERLDSLKRVLAGGRKMVSIIEELLLLSEVRKVDVEKEALDMARLVAEAQQRLDNVIAESGAELVLPAHWPSALGYGPWVEEIWANYISNACKYGGRPPRIELGATPLPDGCVRFWVRDNGPGLSPEAQTRLFTPFTRLDQARAKGHGLGLSIVKRIAEKLEGQVGVESQVGVGSTFSFTLPGAAERAATASGPPTPRQ